jgi:hypothetical protein
MTGSLLQMISTGKKDIFLSIDPQITFFKIVFLRHTIFSLEIVEEIFNIIPNFNESATCLLSKYGDLISNMFLKISIPNVLISNTIDNSLIPKKNITDFITLQNNYKLYIQNYNVFQSSAMYYWRIINNLNNTLSNFTIINSTIQQFISSNDNNYINYSTNLNTLSLLSLQFNINFDFDLLSFISNNTTFQQSIYSNHLTSLFISDLQIYLNNFILFSTRLSKLLIDNNVSNNNIININNSNYYRFSWVSKLGFAIIKRLSILMGGQEIDYLTNDNLNLWFELTDTKNNQETLNNMIGNVSNLTNFNNNLKPSYNLIIPLPFWFCKYKTQAIPCTSLKYHDVMVNVTLQELEKCCLFEPLLFSQYNSNININELITISNVSLLVEYVFLGSDERNKFGNHTHEYLIEQNKQLTYSNNNLNSIYLNLDIYNPIKEIYWVIQSQNIINNYNLWNEYELINVYCGYIDNNNNNNGLLITCGLLDINGKIINTNYINTNINYTYIEIYNSNYYNGLYQITSFNSTSLIINFNKFILSDIFLFKLYTNAFEFTGSFLINENIQIYGQNLQSLRDPLYFSLVQNFQNHSNIPINIHSFSFALNPEEFQPSGSCNFSVIDSKNLYLEFDSEVFNSIQLNNDSFIIKIIARSYNILKIENGYAKLIFSL